VAYLRLLLSRKLELGFISQIKLRCKTGNPATLLYPLVFKLSLSKPRLHQFSFLAQGLIKLTQLETLFTVTMTGQSLSN
jgi:hypothetical protein